MVTLLYDCEVAVFAIACHVVPLSVENSHLTIVPTCPVKAIVPLLPVPAQYVLPPVAVPPTDGASSIIVTALEFGVHGAPGVIVQVNW
jgi:hypothetical protein